MTGAVECRYYGRDFTAEEMALLRALIAVDPQPTRAALSREFCRRIGWFKPDGALKDMMARVTMLAMHRDGLIVLPPPKGRQYRPKPIVLGQDTEPPLFPAPTTLDEVRSLDLRTVVRGTIRFSHVPGSAEVIRPAQFIQAGPDQFFCRHDRAFRARESMPRARAHGIPPISHVRPRA